MKYWEKKELVRNLRSRGLSYKEIREKTPFSVSKSTISAWCKDIELTENQKKRLDKLFKEGSYRGRLLGPKTTQLRRAKEVEEIKKKAASEIISLSKKEFRLAGAMLYWAEGAKSMKYIDITNSDPLLIKFMTDWFRIICDVPKEKFKASLHLHSGQKEQPIKQYWSKITEIPISQFGKSYIKKEGSGYRKNKLYKGTIKIRIYNSNLLYRILGWISGISKIRPHSSIGRADPS